VVEVEIGTESEGEVTSVKMDGGIDRGESRDLDIIVWRLREIFPAQGHYYESSFKFCSISVVKYQGFKVTHMREVLVVWEVFDTAKIAVQDKHFGAAENTSSPNIHTSRFYNRSTEFCQNILKLILRKQFSISSVIS
jgi:hypothetical protein